MAAAARRNAARRGWPRGLYEPRPGYYVWRHPATGETLPIGRVQLSQAKAEAAAANVHVENSGQTLIERMTTQPAAAGETIADALKVMPAAKTTNTAKTWRTLDKRILGGLGNTPCRALTVKACAEFIDAIFEEEGKARTAQAVRSRLIAVCARAQQKGWSESNPAEVTAELQVAVLRGRLTLETFREIRAKADQVAEWLGGAMDLALVTGADRVTVATFQRKQLTKDWLEFQRSKTKIRLRIPLDIELRAAGLRLRDLVKVRTGVVSAYLVHHVRPWGNAPRGSAVHPDRFSHAFTEARRLAGIPDVLPDGKTAPTFHEIRSLAKRLYTAQGNVDTQWLLGHQDHKTARLYADPRGAEAVTVKVDPLPPSELQVNTK